mgnify:FL=1
MTNKLRSVIDKLYEDSTTMTVDPDSPQVVHYEDAVKAVFQTLHAVIEEVNKSTQTTTTHILDMKKLNYTEQDIDFHRGSVMYAIDLLGSLKQALEELSTSLTQ